MITESTLLRLKKWFEEYVKSFEQDDIVVRTNHKLKEQHTKNVCMEILSLANSLDLGREDCFLAETVALLHDVGRFGQFAKYRTFVDGKSTNHAKMSIDVINGSGVLRGIEDSVHDLILDVVGHHNCAVVPNTWEEYPLLFLKMLRDADKIDIWRVVTEHYQNPNGPTNPSIELDLPDEPKVSPGIILDLLQGRLARIQHLETLNDFKLLQIGWVFDLNFSKSFQVVKKRRYLDTIYQVLPHVDMVKQVYQLAISHVNRGCQIPGNVAL